MSLPAVIEVVPPAEPPVAQITVPGSKSITNRALILAALGTGRITLSGALWSEDTQVMVEALRRLGYRVDVETDPNESANRSITVEGNSGRIPTPGGSVAEPLELFVGNAGTAARFLSALACLGQGVFRLSGVSRMHERPQADLFAALRQLGYRVDSDTDRLPALIHGGGPRQGACEVGIQSSSQFASALLLASRAGGWEVRVRGENTEESSYVAMTRELMKAFPEGGGTFQIEPDASSGSYFWAAGNLKLQEGQQSGAASSDKSLGQLCVSVNHWPSSGWQIDQGFPAMFLRLMRGSRHYAGVMSEGLGSASGLGSPIEVSRRLDLGDSIMTAIALAPLAAWPTRFVDLGRLRVQECERVAALRTELTRCGARVQEEGDTLRISPSELHGAEIQTYNDHRMAMCLAILGLKVPGIRLQNPACVRKTFPNFFRKLTAPPPRGLGVTLRDGIEGRILTEAELSAE